MLTHRLSLLFSLTDIATDAKSDHVSQMETNNADAEGTLLPSNPDQEASCPLNFNQHSGNASDHSVEEEFVLRKTNNTYQKPFRCAQIRSLSPGQKPSWYPWKYRCRVCGILLCTVGVWRMHEATHSTQSCVSCSRYKTSCSSSFLLKCHVVFHHPGQVTLGHTVSCNVKCSSNAKQSQAKFKCYVCSAHFMSAATLICHKRRHNPPLRHKCPYCDKRFSRYSSLRSHVGHRHAKPPALNTAEDKAHSCDLCHRTFQRASNLKAHQSVHRTERPFKCSVCEKSFRRKDSWQIHLRSHSGEQPYCCEICGKNFAHRQSLSRHHLAHSGAKPYTCSICGAAFSQISNCVSHEKTHCGVKPYSCTVCGKCFSRSSGLRDHKRIHSGERPYKCNVCGKAFTTHSHVQRHVVTHMATKPYTCSICFKTFTQPSSLATHKKIHLREGTC